MFGLLYRKRDHGEQFDQDLYDDLFHRCGGWDPCIDGEALQERFEGFEKLDDGIVALVNIFDRLMEKKVTSSSKPKLDTYAEKYSNSSEDCFCWWE